MQFKEYDIVKVVCLEKLHRHIDGSRNILRQPQIGDEGTIVYIPVTATDKAVYIVECVDNDGYTIWLADFVSEELEFITRPSDPKNDYE